MRGKHQRFDEDAACRGLIPAHAGKTGPDSNRHNAHPDHPRSRRENEYPPSASAHIQGSSPLTRGKRRPAPPVRRRRRLIPAHAGKTSLGRARAARSEAHPRSCGENNTAEYATACQLGSSPLMRGKLRRGSQWADRPRLIPAHAGKTCTRRGSPSPCGVHPRSCGENSTDFLPWRISSGSSPLMRGKLDAFHLARHVVGLIPAHARKTRSSAATALW